MKSISLKFIILLLFCVFFFFILPLFNGEDEKKTERVVGLYMQKLEEPLTEPNQFALFGHIISFPFKISELPEAFHIKSMYYDEMSDGIDAGDYFYCNLLNEQENEVAYIRVSNLKQNRADSPEGMTVTYIEVSSFVQDRREYAVPFEIIYGIGIGSTNQEVRQAFPEITVNGNGDYAIGEVKLGANTLTMEFSNGKVYKLSVKVYQ